MKDTIFFYQAKLLVSILPQIAKEKVFAIKGGTAINYFYRNLPRISVDIDLTYLPIKTREESINDISIAIGRIIEGLIYTVPNVRIITRKDAGRKLTIGFVAVQKNITVKVEPNTIIRGAVYQAETRSFCEQAKELFSSNVRIQNLSFADLYGGKICAALDRQHPRDLFDINLLYENEGITEEIRKAFIVYLISHSRPIVELINPNFKDIRSVFENEFLGMTRNPISFEELLETRERLVRQIQKDLTGRERRFLLSIKKCESDWSLLGVDGISDLPAVQWKLHNLALMQSTKHKEAVEKLQRCLKI